ncbi:lipase family protein [Paenibacillus filicis]|uniref:Lipase family protein n=1 Tax=Paenibacillus filicis TaxID=669464 RepID=A0ABU9DGF7_9BACL
MSSSPFDTRNAIFLAAVCGQTYSQFDNQDGTFVLPHGYRLIASFKASSFMGSEAWFGFITESADRIIIAFRGTNTRPEWISNSIARQTPYPFLSDSGLVHSGFLDIYRTARKSILSALRKLPEDRKLFITGHSLGGALATLCAVDVAANSKFKSPVVYTYASPRVGNPKFAMRFNNLLSGRHRIYNNNDLVPGLPPLVYRSPKTDRTYFYVHVKKGFELSFQNGSVSANHSLPSYFDQLAKLNPAYTREMCSRNPGFCPV